jgi:mRNA interferase MazF
VAIRPWEVRYADLDPSEGNEQVGLRPCVVVSSQHHLRLHAGRLVTVVPLTSTQRPGWSHHVKVERNGRIGYAITDQLRTISGRRFSANWNGWQLTADEQAAVQAQLRRMTDW